jgi:hypothetical protein
VKTGPGPTEVGGTGHSASNCTRFGLVFQCVAGRLGVTIRVLARPVFSSRGVEVPGAEVDADPFASGIGAEPAGGGVVGAELTRIQIHFTKAIVLSF